MKLLDQSDLPQKFKSYLALDEKLKQVVEAVKPDFDQSGLRAHNWEHIYRDALNAIVVGEAEGADMIIVLPAIAMHDIGFLYGADGKTHGAVGADKLSEFLKKHDIQYSKKDIQKISSCIRTHKGSMHGEKPENLEAKVVADADLLEKFGPLGVYQHIRTWTEFNFDLADLLRRGQTVDDLQLSTETGKRLAEPGRQFVKDFYRELAEANQPYKDGQSAELL